MTYNKTCGCIITEFIIAVLFFRITYGQLNCYFGFSSNVSDQALLSKTCSEKYVHQMNLTSGSTVNVSHSLVHPEMQNVSYEDAKFCLVFFHEDGMMTDYTCDTFNICTSEGVNGKLISKGILGTAYCCKTNFCNSEEAAKKVVHLSNFSCFSEPEISCDGHRCMNRTVYLSNGTALQHEFGCANESVCNGEQAKDECLRVQMSTGFIETCFCSGSQCNKATVNYSTPAFLTTTLKPPLFMTNPYFSQQKRDHGWAFVGTLAAVAVLVILFVILVIIGVKKFRDHRAQHLTYTYTQLTADLAEERDTEDEYMLIG